MQGLPYDYPTLGFHHLGSDATRGKQCVIRDVIFSNFNARGCNVLNKLNTFVIHPEASDLIMEHIFERVRYHDVSPNKVFYLMDPP